MSVIVSGGEFKGRVLKTPTRGVRPTQQKTRQAVFSILDSRCGGVANKGVIDLCAGSGALGIEALSRGASWLLLVEENRQTSKVIQENLDTLNISEDQAQVVVSRGETFLKNPRALETRETSELVVFCDPPYESTPQHWLHEIVRSSLWRPGTCLVLEGTKKADWKITLPEVALVVMKDYKDTVIGVFQYALPSSLPRIV